MDFFYDGQIRRYVTQFMRMFIGFQYQDGDGALRSIPVSYGNLTKQVAQIIKENSENKLPSVPKIACYITGLEYDRNRLADPSFVSKLSLRERDYEFDENGDPVYGNTQGGGYTVERLMPTPFRLSMRADLWTSNTDQKLQILEQILVLFNPSLEVQTTDNYIDWTSLTVVELTGQTFSSRSIPQGTEVDIDIASLDFEMPIYISPPVKVKKLGVVQNIVMNMFDTETGDLKTLNELAFNINPDDNPDYNSRSVNTTPGGFGVLLLSAKTVTGVDTGTYYVSVLDSAEAVKELGLDVPIKQGISIDWNKIMDLYGGYKPGISQVRFLQPSGNELVGTFTVNPLDSSYLDVTFDEDTIPDNSTDIPFITGIVDPTTFNPIAKFGGIANIPNATRYLILEDIGNRKDIIVKTLTLTGSTNVIRTNILYKKTVRNPAWDPSDNDPPQTVDVASVAKHELYINGVKDTVSTLVDRGQVVIQMPTGQMIPAGATVRYVLYLSSDYDADPNNNTFDVEPIGVPAAWKNGDGSDFVADANDIIQWDSSTQQWSIIFDSTVETDVRYLQNQNTMVQYKWDGEQWVKSFEGEYTAGYWSFNLVP